LEVIQETNRAIENLGTAARHRAGIAPPTLTKEQLDHAEAHLALGMQVPRIDPPEGDRAAISTADLYHDAIETGAALGDASALDGAPVDDGGAVELSPSDDRPETNSTEGENPSPPRAKKKWSID
jgi:hypothetical protein